MKLEKERLNRIFERFYTRLNELNTVDESTRRTLIKKELESVLSQEIQTAVQKERKRILKEFVLAECEIPGEGKYGRAEFYHLSKTKYNELKDKS